LKLYVLLVYIYFYLVLVFLNLYLINIVAEHGWYKLEQWRINWFI